MADVKKREREIKSMYPARIKRAFPFGDTIGSCRYSDSTRLAELPERATVEALVNCYLVTFDKLFPLLDPPAFQREVAEFYQNPSGVRNEWLAQLYMVLALACYASPACSLESYPGGIEGLSGQLLNGAEAAFTQTSFLLNPCHRQFTTTRVLCMIAIAKQLDIMTHNDSDTCWQYMGLVVRLAMGLWLHRSPDSFDTMPFAESQERKRIWITVAQLDLFTSIAAGMQTQCQPEDCNTPAPSKSDEDIDDTEVVYQKKLAQILPILSGIINKLNSPQSEMEYDEVLRLDSQLRGLLHSVELPEMMGSGTPANWMQLQATTLSNMIRRVRLAVHQPWARI